MPDDRDTLLAIRPCGCAIGMVAADCAEAAPAQARYQAAGWSVARVPAAEAIRRLRADFTRHASGQCSAVPPVQLALFGEAA